jgi:putative heme-binding domain-containing protein
MHFAKNDVIFEILCPMSGQKSDSRMSPREFRFSRGFRPLQLRKFNQGQIMPVQNKINSKNNNCQAFHASRFFTLAFLIVASISGLASAATSGSASQAKKKSTSAKVKPLELPANLLGFEKLAGSISRGNKLFHSRLDCSSCHSVESDDSEMMDAPNLWKIADNLTRREMVESILLPSRVISKGYQELTVITEDGDVLVGEKDDAKSTATTLALKIDGRVRLVKRIEIEGMKVASSSMPTGQADDLTAQEFADLIAYLNSLRTQVVVKN